MLSGPDCNCGTHLAIFLSSAWMQHDLIKLWRFLSSIARPGSRIRESKLRLAQIKLIQFTCWILTKPETIYKRASTWPIGRCFLFLRARTGQLYRLYKATISLILKEEQPGISVIFSRVIICVKKGLKIWGILGPKAKGALCACLYSHTKT